MRAQALVLLFTLVSVSAPTSTVGASDTLREHRRGELLVRFGSSTGDAAARRRLGSVGADVRRRLTPRRTAQPGLPELYLVALPEGLGVARALDVVGKLLGVAAVQPNYVHHRAGVPDDPGFPSLWGLHNVGQPGNRGPLSPVTDADIDWLEAWDLLDQRPPPLTDVVVAVIDTGIALDHEDLQSVLWTNPGEIPGNGVDDDGNGYVDDVHGWDFATNVPSPADGDGHGTHVSGTIAAATDNGVGVAGVARRHVRIMACKFLDDTGSGTTADAIEAIHYAIDNGAKVLNNAWSGGPFEASLYDAIVASNDAGAVFVAPAGNTRTDSDVTPSYPGAYDVPNVVSVAASTRHERLAEFSSWGLTMVDLAAPGEEIYSAVAPAGYEFLSGTSLATAPVSGALAVAFAYELATTPAEAIALLLDSTDPSPAFAGRMTTEGRLNLANLVERGLGIDVVPPGPITDLGLAVASPNGVTLKFTASGDDSLAGRATRYDLRYGPAAGFDFATAARAGGGFIPAVPGATDYVFVTGLAPSTAYRFQLRVLDKAGNATLSNALTTATTAPPPAGETLVTILTEPCDSPGGFVLQPAWGIESASYLSDSPGTDYPNDVLAAATLATPLDLSQATRAYLSFDLDYDFEVYQGEPVDELFVEASTDEQHWFSLKRYGGTRLVLSRDAIDITRFAGMPTVRLRFVLSTDAAVSKAGARIDNITVDVAPVVPGNQQPIAVDDTAETAPRQSVTVDVLANDVDPDGDTLVATLVGKPTQGAVRRNHDGTFRYKARRKAQGTDSFVYAVSDGHGGVAQATVTVTIRGDAPPGLASEGFESGNFAGGTGFTDAWQTSGDIKIVSTRLPRSGLRHARLRGGAASITRIVDLTGVMQPRLKFWVKGSSFESGESAVILVSVDGVTFITVATLAQAEADDTWRSYDIDLASLPGTAAFAIRFDANMSGTNDVFYVDDVTVEGIR